MNNDRVKVIVYIKDHQIIAESDEGKHTHTFNNHSELESAIKDYWIITLRRFANLRLCNCEYEMSNEDADKAIEYAKKLQYEFNDAVHKTAGNNKTVRLTAWV